MPWCCALVCDLVLTFALLRGYIFLGKGLNRRVKLPITTSIWVQSTIIYITYIAILNPDFKASFTKKYILSTDLAQQCFWIDHIKGIFVSNVVVHVCYWSMTQTNVPPISLVIFFLTVPRTFSTLMYDLGMFSYFLAFLTFLLF